MIKLKNLFGLIITGLMVFNCTDLNEKVLDNVLQEKASSEYAVNNNNATALLAGAYNALRDPFQSHERFMALDEHTTDAMVGPTRGGDWDDNGVWRALHNHTYAPDHTFIRETWNAVYAAINDANFVIGSSTANKKQLAEARFLRALCYYHCIDLWGQVAYREIGSDPNDNAPVYTRTEATDWVISELEEILSDLPASSNPTVANQNAAHWLLAKMYLNKGIFTGDAANPTFEPVDLDKVIMHVDAITGVSLAADYWDNFIPKNTETSPELIFVSVNIGGSSSAEHIRSRWYMGQHYNQEPSGWNGFTTLSEYYNRFDPKDPRIFKEFPEVTAGSGYNVGFQVGQQYGPGGTDPLKDRKGNLLIFTPEITLITEGKTLETAGVRGVKYVPDYSNVDQPDNDFVVARFADALLMKAEALARKGDMENAQKIVQSLQHESSTTITDVTDIYDVRARELWWEGWRRNDMIRFGTFLKTRELKPYISDPKYLLIVIPADALANPNFTQNPGH